MTLVPPLRLAPEYGCWPLWDAAGENPLPEAWPFSPELTARLVAWDEVFQATLEDYPPDSRFASPAAEIAWRAEGEALAEAIRAHLGADHLIVRF